MSYKMIVLDLDDTLLKMMELFQAKQRRHLKRSKKMELKLYWHPEVQHLL